MNFEGFSMRWYEEFLEDTTLRESLFTSLEIATVTMVAATVIGTCWRSAWSRPHPLEPGRQRADAGAAGDAGDRRRDLGPADLLPDRHPPLLLDDRLAHITFSISYVTIVVRARLATMGREAEEAAMDLGATRWESVRLVLLPALWPAVVAAGLLVFAFSFDDFVLSFFTTGEDVQPLPVRIWSAIRFGLSPTINAIGTLMMVVSLTAIGLAR